MTPRIDHDIERVADGFEFVEGPVWLDADAAARAGLGPTAGLFFSDIEANTQYLLRGGQVTAVRSPSGAANGNALDRDGRLVSCEHARRRVARRDDTGTWTTVVDRVGDKRLNSPNDICGRGDGTIFFTDPPYGIDPADSELDVNGVYRLDPAGSLHLVDGALERPNGVAIDPDGRSLWVADTESGTVVRYRFGEGDDQPDVDRRLEGFERPDGMAFDSGGRLLVAVVPGIAVVATDGTRDLVPLPVRPANLCFGGPAGTDVWVCARSSIFRLPWPRAGLPLVPT